MSIKIYSLQGLPDAALESVASFVAEFTNSPAGLEAKLLPLTPQEVASRVGFVACDGPEFRGYAGVSPRRPNDAKVELGPFIVPERYRRGGIGGMLLASAVYDSAQKGYTPYVYGNTANMGNLTRAGFAPLGEGEKATFPNELCSAKCKLYGQIKPCCNTAVVWQGELQEPGPELSAWPQTQALRMS